MSMTITDAVLAELNGPGYTTRKRIEALTGLSRSRVQAGLAELVKMGFVEWRIVPADPRKADPPQWYAPDLDLGPMARALNWLRLRGAPASTTAVERGARLQPCSGKATLTALASRGLVAWEPPLKRGGRIKHGLWSAVTTEDTDQ